MDLMLNLTFTLTLTRSIESEQQTPQQYNFIFQRFSLSESDILESTGTRSASVCAVMDRVKRGKISVGSCTYVQMMIVVRYDDDSITI